MKKAIVTGANGFVGSWLIKELIKHNVEVLVVVRSNKSNLDSIKDVQNKRVVYCPLEEIITLDKKVLDRDFDAFFHLAWAGVGGKSRSDYCLQLMNVKYACDAALVAKKMGCNKFLCAGTITEKIAENVLCSEVKAENTIYGICKNTNHKILDVLCKSITLDYVWMQLSNIYGPFNNSGNIIDYTLNELKNGNIPEFSSGNQPYDLMYVEDAVKAIYLLGECNTKVNYYFVGSGRPRLLREYLLEIKDIIGENAEIALGKRTEDGLVYRKDWFDTKQLIDDVGFSPNFTFENGIKETIKWLKSKK